MKARKYLFPDVIELNYQAERKLGVNVYLVDGGDSFILIDIGYEDKVDEIVDLMPESSPPMPMRTTPRAWLAPSPG